VDFDADYAMLNKIFATPSAKTSLCGCRRAAFTRLTNAFSKKFENHCHALVLYLVFYNSAASTRR
jgi:hypothetical protein